MAKDNKRLKGLAAWPLIGALFASGVTADSTPAASDNTLDNANSETTIERSINDATIGLVNEADVATVENGTLIQEGVVVDDVNQVADGDIIPPIPGEEKDRINTSSEGYGTNQTPKTSGIQNDDEGRAVNGRLEQPGVVDEDVNTVTTPEGNPISKDHDPAREREEQEVANQNQGIPGVVPDHELPQEDIIFQSGGEQKDSPVKIK